MIEVEAKIGISAREAGKIRAKIKKIARFKRKEEKIDDYYALELEEKYPEKSLRIRKANGFYIANFKKRISYIGGVHAKKETEFKVSDIGGFLKLIGDFGFRKWLRKEKRCEIYEIAKNFHIELNNVKELGWFIEIEYLAEKEKDIAGARKKVSNIIKMLGFNENNCIKKGYTKQLWDLIKRF